MADTALATRPTLVHRGLRLNYLTIGYNTLEAIVALAAGLVAGSVALVGFGVDSGIEVTASLAAQWRLRADLDPEQRERVERITHRVIGGSFLALAAYVAVEGVTTLWEREAPGASKVGLVILLLSVLIMPALARAKRRVARGLQSRALEADATDDPDHRQRGSGRSTRGSRMRGSHLEWCDGNRSPARCVSFGRVETRRPSSGGDLSTPAVASRNP